MQKTFKLISEFWSDFESSKKTISHVAGYNGFCQCESEKVIEKSKNPERTRAFLIIGILVDQALTENKRNFDEDLYEEFTLAFTYPKLEAHFDGSECPSSWFCYPQHGYDKKLNWLNVEAVCKTILVETRTWLLTVGNVHSYNLVRNSILKSIDNAFRAYPEGERLTKLVEKYF